MNRGKQEAKLSYVPAVNSTLHPLFSKQLHAGKDLHLGNMSATYGPKGLTVAKH